MADNSKPSAAPAKPWLTDTLASMVVFLVALPLCIGIAVACNVPPERGLLTGIVGGIIVGSISGAPLLVSGPAASLIVPVYDLVSRHGLKALAPVVMLAGVWQALAGVLRLGQWFRAVAPAVIHGMLIGIGVLILGSQIHVAIDEDPKASFIQNVVTIPGAIFARATGGVDAATPIAILLLTIILLVGWNHLRPKRLELVPGHLVALVGVTTLSTVMKLPLRFLKISSNFFAGLDPVGAADFSVLLQPSMIVSSLTFAFIASAATLLTATAIDQRQSHTKTDYDREMLAQGVGNAIVGALGGLPMTGVIVRSSVNVDAGARTRRSTIVHGIWLLLFVAVAPQVLELIPRASLGAILVFTGYKLINYKVFYELWDRGRSELLICLITLFGVVFVDLFSGIIAGFMAALLKVVYTFTHLKLRSSANDNGRTHDLHITGSATFVRLPQLARALEKVSEERELHIHIENLNHIDHACLELLSAWSQRREHAGQPGMVVEWEELTHRYKSARQSTDKAPPSKSMLRIVWEEWKNIYAAEGSTAENEKVVRDRWLEASRAHAHLEADALAPVLRCASKLLAPHVEQVDAAALLKALSHRKAGHVAIGDGVCLPHAAIPGLTAPKVALITTASPIAVDNSEADLFFVVLAPEDDPQTHLRTLAHVGRLCHDPDLLQQLRKADSAEMIVSAVEMAETSITDQALPKSGNQTKILAVIEVDTKAAAEQLRPSLTELFGETDIWRPAQAASLRTLLHIEPIHQLIALKLDLRDLRMLRALIDEQNSLLPGKVSRVHQLQTLATESLDDDHAASTGS